MLKLVALKRLTADEEEEWVWFCEDKCDEWLWERHLGVNCLVEEDSNGHRKLLEIQNELKHYDNELVHFDLKIRQK